MEVVKAVNKVKELPPELHWFCPRSSIRDHRLFFEEDLIDATQAESDLPDAERERKIEESNSRKTLVYEALQIFAFDGNDAVPLQTWLQENLDIHMSRCETCARQYHRGRTELKEKLEGSYEEDEVRSFLARFDQINTTRIKRGLLRARKSLEAAPAEERGVRSVDTKGLYAIFETLNCDGLLADEAFLVEHFDDAFLLIQQKRRLKLTSYTPAMSYFLFQDDSTRRWWAATSWSKFKRRITATEFQWSVRQPFLRAAGRVRLDNLEKDFLPMFWAGVKCIVEHLDADLINHSLRALDCNICMLALDHLQVDTVGFRDLLLTMNRILLVSPSAFWEALRASTVAVWIEQFVNSPALDRFLYSQHSHDDDNLLRDLFQWTIPFISTLKALQQPAACKGLVGQLFGRFQSEKYAPRVRIFCYNLATDILVSCLKDLTTDKISSNTRVAIKDILDVVNLHIARITSHANRRLASPTGPSAELLRRALTLEAYCLISDRELLHEDRPLHLGTCMTHADIWSYSVKTITQGSAAQASQILLGAKPLVGLEHFMVSKGQGNTTKRHFNETLDTCNHYVSELLERVSDLGSKEVQNIFNDNEGAIAIVGQLSSSSAEVRSAAIEVIKTATEKTIRNEALGDVLASYFAETLDAYSLSLRRIHYLVTFAPAPSMLNICKDLLDVLCDSSRGLLRIGTMAEAGIKATETFWEAMWLELGTIFRSAEAWANSGHDKTMMTKFCGDVMELAGMLFDKFPVFSAAISSSAEPDGRSRTAGKRLTDQPKTTLAAMIRFLRLRDDFLLAKSTALVCDVLRRLKQFDTAVEEAALSQLEKMLRGEVNTVLTPNQKAELHSALEHHLGRTVVLQKEVPPSSAVQKKPSKAGVIDLDKWKAKAGADDRPLNVESVIKSSTKSADAFKERQAAKAAAEKLPFFNKNKAQATERKDVNADKIARERQEAAATKQRRDREMIARMRGRLNPEGVDGLTAQQGSGIAGLGLSGKDHSVPRGTGMMVSSDESEDDDSEDELDRQLFGGKKVSKTSEELRRFNEAKARRPEPQGPVKKQRLVRSAKDNRARLAPDLAPLHKTLLSWDFNHEGAIPPRANMQDYASVLSTFRDPVDYQNTFRPLLTLEAWNGFLKAKDENNAKPFEIKIINRSTVDAFNEVSASIDHKDAKEIGDGDIILLSKASNMSSRRADDVHCLARVGKVTRKKTHLEFLGKVMPGTSMSSVLAPNAKVFGLKIMSIIPLEREYGALLGLQFYDLCDEITKARPSPLLKYGDNRLQPLMDKYTVNKAQAKAIQSALDNDAFTLIQGPPGSGKTKTIVGIVGALLTDTLRQPGNANPQPRSEFIANRPPSKKLLVCAPSNAAVDELVMRFKEGVTITTGEHKKVGVVRLGRSDAINTSVVDVTLDEMVNKRLNIVPVGTAREETQKLMTEHQAVSKSLREAIDLADKDDNAANRQQRDDLRRKKAVLSQKIDTAKDNEGMQTRQADLNRRRAQQDIIEESQVICATLSGSGHDMFQNLNVEFETVVIDEAAQCVELSALIPLKYGCAKCVLVGDPQQLPPTVFSKEAANFKYEQSLFVRMQSNHPHAVHLLDTQYRMHPDISAFPSEAFYDGKLLDGPDMVALRNRPWHAADLLGPFQFFDVQGQHQSAPRGHSLVNHAEVRVAMQLYTRLTRDFKQQTFRGNVGIITPYKSQLRELKEQFQRQFGSTITEDIEFNTTDAFQGRESEIIIFSCVRASPSGGIGFLQDIRRMNVGLTRAKTSMWVLGNSQSLVKGEYWRKLVEHARASGHFFDGDIEGVLSKPLKKVKEVENMDMDVDVDGNESRAVEKQVERKMPNISSRGASIVKTASSTKVQSTGARYADPLGMQALPNNSAPPSNSTNKRKLSNINSSKNATTISISSDASSSTSASSSSSSSSNSDTEMPDAPSSPKRSNAAQSAAPPASLSTVPNGHVPSSSSTTTMTTTTTASNAGSGSGGVQRPTQGQGQAQGPGPLTTSAGVTKRPIVKKRKKETSIFMKKPTAGGR